MNIIENFLEVKLFGSDTFNIVTETLGRIGIRENNNLYQECFILHKKEQYYIVHYKELLLLDGLDIEILEDDYSYRNTVASLFFRWGFVNIVDKKRFFFLIENEKKTIDEAREIVSSKESIKKLFLMENLSDGDIRKPLKKTISVLKAVDKESVNLIPKYLIGKNNPNVK